MNRSWELLADPDTGRLDRLWNSDKMPVPTMEANGSYMLFDFSKKIRSESVPSDLLERFLSAQTNADLMRFARRFGPLALFQTKADNVRWPDPQRLADHYDDPHREELGDWRRCQQQMRAALSLMATVSDHKTPTVEDLDGFNDAVGGAFLKANVLERVKTNAMWRRDLAVRAALFYTRALAFRCRLAPALRLRNQKMEMVFQDAAGNLPGGALSLPGALTLRLMSAFAADTLPTLCSSCGNPYVPKRKPAAGKYRFCQKCGKTGSWKLSKRRQREAED